MYLSVSVMCTHVHLRVKARSQCQVSSVTLHLIETGSLTELQRSDCLPVLVFSIGAGGTDSGAYA